MMTKRTAQPRSNCCGAFKALRSQLAIFNGLIARSEKACTAGAISAKDRPAGPGDTVVDNLAHLYLCHESIGRVLDELGRRLQAQTGDARLARRI
jgi:hypothetical protein